MAPTPQAAPFAAKTYRLNLVRNLRDQEHKRERQRRLIGMLGACCFAVLALSLAYSGLTVWNMERVLSAEQAKLAYLQNEYRGYTAARLIVDKNDLESLSGLQGKGIFWTRKLAALAKHLPDNYWITAFAYTGGELRVSGYGLPSPKQEELIILDGYLTALRADSAFSDIFKALYLNKSERRDEMDSERVRFEFSALTQDAPRAVR